MAGTHAIIGAALEGAIRNEFLETYESEYESMEAELRDMARIAIPSTRIKENYVYFESAPHPKRQDRDQSMSFGDYQPKSFKVVNHEFSKGIRVHKNDKDDDQTGGGFVGRAGQLGENFALLPERIFYQMLLSETDDDLLPAVPNAPDGVAMFSATDGQGNARFGRTGGNIVTGIGIANASQIRTTFMKGVSGFGRFRDSKDNQPLIHPSKLRQFAVWYNINNIEVFNEAFKGQRSIKTAGAGEAAAVTNVIDEAGIQVTLYPTSRITTNDWYMRNTGTSHYSLFEQSRSPLATIRGDQTNSDSARLTGYDYMGWNTRSGFGLALPYDWIQLDEA